MPHILSGKTTFLIYLLLHRLEKMRPTAIQFGTAHYFIFDKHGAVIRPLDYKDDRLRACWALSDSNASNVAGPCEAFLGGALRVIQTTPPKPERWKEWIKQKEGSAVVMDLPNVMEIAAVVLVCYVFLLLGVHAYSSSRQEGARLRSAWYA